MSDVTLDECIYVKRSKGKFGSGSTSRETVLETFWYPHKTDNGHVALYPVSDDLKRVLRLEEKVPVELFQKEFSVKDDSKEIYLELKKLVA